MVYNIWRVVEVHRESEGSVRRVVMVHRVEEVYAEWWRYTESGEGTQSGGSLCRVEEVHRE